MSLPAQERGSLNPRKGHGCFFSCQNTSATLLLPPLITTLTISSIIGLMAFIEHILCPRQHGTSNDVVPLLSLSYRGRNGGSESGTCPRPHSLGARLDQQLKVFATWRISGALWTSSILRHQGQNSLPFTIPGRSPSCLSGQCLPCHMPQALPHQCPGRALVSAFPWASA